MAQAVIRHQQLRGRVWEIWTGDEGVPVDVLQIGTQAWRVSDVVGYRDWYRHEPNVDGHLLALALLSGVGGLLLLPVVLKIADPKFLIGAILYIGIGLSVFGDLRRNTPVTLYGLDIDLRDGSTFPFRTANIEELKALRGALDARIGHRG